MPAPHTEPLEPRRLLAITLTLDGTEGNDVISVRVEGGNVIIDVNGTVTSTPDDDVQDILINGRGGADIVEVDSNTNNAVTLNGGNGDDDIRLAPDSRRMDRITAFVMVNGDDGADRLSMDDRNATTGATWHITAPVIGRSNGSSILPRTEQLTLLAGAGDDAISVQNHRMLLDAGDGTDGITVTENGFTGMTTLLASGGDDNVWVNFDGFGVANVTLHAQRLGSLRIGGGGHVMLEATGTSSALVTRTLELTGSARLNVRDHAVIVDYTGASPIDSIATALASGYAGGTWNGPGINSSVAAAEDDTALGYAEAADLFATFPATFEGQQIDATSVLIKYTFYGDADLNERVDLHDFNRLAANFGGTNRRWSQGDFDFDRDVDLDDFNRLAAHFGASAAATTSATELLTLNDRDDARDDVIT